MSVALDATTAYDCGSTGQSSKTVSHTVAGSDRYLVVSVIAREAGSDKHANTVTYNGVSMTEVANVDITNTLRLQWFALIAPATGTHDVVITMSAAAFFAGGVRSFTGVHQTTPTGTFATNSGSSTAPSVTVTSATGEYVADVAGHLNSTSTAAVGSGQTSDFNTATSSGTAANNVRAYGSHEPGASSVVMDWTLTGGSRSWVSAGVSLKPSAAGDTTAPNTTITAGPAHGGRTLDNTPTFTFTSDEAVSLPATFEGRVDGGSYSTITSPWTLTTLSEGSHTVDIRATDSVGNVDATPATRTFTVNATATLDVFLVAGQSNAEGRGSSAGSTVVTEGEGYVWNGTDLIHLADPVGGATTGSAWPAFGATYFAATGRIAVIVEQAEGGTAQAAAANSGNGHWDVGGTLYAPAAAALNAAVADIDTDYPAATVNARGILWAQGERDGQAIDAATITKATYKAALVAMIARFRTDVTSGLQFYISQTGYDDSTGDTTGFQQVRAAQQEVADTDPLTCMAFTGAVLFPTTSKSNGLHYTQTGYNEMGAAMATFVAAPAYTGTATVTAVARATASGFKAATGTATVTGVATITSSGSKDAAPSFTGTATLNAVAAITASGTKAATGTATLNAVARITASGSQPTISRPRWELTPTTERWTLT